jgi:hypothetical protein
MCVQRPGSICPPFLAEALPLRYDRSVGFPLTVQSPIHQACCQFFPAMLRQSSPLALLVIETQASNVNAAVGLSAAFAGIAEWPVLGDPLRVSQAPKGWALAVLARVSNETTTAKAVTQCSMFRVPRFENIVSPSLAM